MYIYIYIHAIHLLHSVAIVTNNTTIVSLVSHPGWPASGDSDLGYGGYGCFQ